MRSGCAGLNLEESMEGGDAEVGGGWQSGQSGQDGLQSARINLRAVRMKRGRTEPTNCRARRWASNSPPPTSSVGMGVGRWGFCVQEPFDLSFDLSFPSPSES